MAQQITQKKIIQEQIMPMLAPGIQRIIQRCSPPTINKTHEIRLRENRPLMLCWDQGDCMLDCQGKVVYWKEKAYTVQREDIQKTLQLTSNYSLYAFEEELKNGYLTIPGGHRIGLVGKAVLSRGKIKLQKHITGINIRITREVTGAGEKVLPYVLGKNSRVYSTLIISPPQCGKTTLLRDLVRLLSCGKKEFSFPGVKVGLVDERSEIAGCFQGLPQNDVGIRTDVIDACPKAQGMMLLIRSMSPQVLATDEIGSLEDALAVEEALKAGVSVLATAHGSNLEEFKKRPGLKKMLEHKIFKRFIFLGNTRGTGTIEKIWDHEQSKRLL